MPFTLRFGFALVLAMFFVGVSLAQPRKEEEEEPPKEKARPVVPMPAVPAEKKEDPKADVPAPAGADADVRSILEELQAAKTAPARDFFNSLKKPYDRLISSFGEGTVYRCELLPFRELPETEFEVQVLDSTLSKSTSKTFKQGSGFRYIPWEIHVMAEVDKFLEKKVTLDRVDQLDVVTRALASTLQFHITLVDKKVRKDPAWSEVQRELSTKLLRLERERFLGLVEAKAYVAADQLALRLLRKHPDNLDVQKDVYWLQLLRLAREARANSDADLLKLREYLLAYEQLPGKKDDALTLQCRRRLRDRSTALVAEAKSLNDRKMAAPALAKLRQAEAIDPDSPGIADVRGRLQGTVLYVGVAQLPENMSPATAVTESEKWAVELMFEGPLQAVPDLDVVRYRPCLCEGLPTVMPLGRSFTLPRNIRWSREVTDPLDARDIKGTLALLRRPNLKDRWCADGLDVLREIDRIDDPFRFRLAYEQGVLEPLSRATFKVLPARYLQERGKAADDREFGERPFGTGPFRYEGREKEGADRTCAVFRANPLYEQRAGRFGLPWVREIRFYVPDQSKLNPDIIGGQMHLFPDAPADVVARCRNEDALQRIVNVVQPSTNRRIHMLAVNHRRTHMQNDKLRQGISAAIDRDKVLTEVYRRPGLEKNHSALTGPFPRPSWATPPQGKEASLYKPGAGGLIAEGLGGSPIRIRMIFPAGDKKLAEAAQLIRTQIELASQDKTGKALIELDAAALPPQTFREKLELEFDYDLALTTFDYRDDLYSLAGLLDPEAAGRAGRNLLGYLAAGTAPTDADRRLRKLIDEARLSRNFGQHVRDKTWELHSLFNQRLPFIPLWQLDRLMVVHRTLEFHFESPDLPSSPEKIDPAVLFTGIEMWRLQ